MPVPGVRVRIRIIPAPVIGVLREVVSGKVRVRMLQTVVNHTDHDSRTIVGVPDCSYIGILARRPASLSSVVKMPLFVIEWVIWLESRRDRPF